VKRPYITIKFAETLDGKIAAKDKSSKWVSSPESRKFAHKLRSESDAILAGIGTVLRDDPSLSCRLVKGKNPVKIIIDGKLRIPPGSEIIRKARREKAIIITTTKAPKRKIRELEKRGADILVFKSKNGRVGIKKLTSALYQKGIKTMLVEGGKQIITAFIKAGLADRIIVIIAPKILGSGIDPVGDLGINNIKSALKLRIKTVTRLGQDVIITALRNRLTNLSGL